jgi:hypothetical protein
VNICTTTNSYFGANEGGFGWFQWTQQVDEVDIDLKTGICVFPTTWSQYYPSLTLASSATLHMSGDVGYFVSLDKDLSLNDQCEENRWVLLVGASTAARSSICFNSCIVSWVSINSPMGWQCMWNLFRDGEK